MGVGWTGGHESDFSGLGGGRLLDQDVAKVARTRSSLLAGKFLGRGQKFQQGPVTIFFCEKKII
jgi:hypothetical protein